MNRFEFVKYDDISHGTRETFKKKFEALADFIEACPTKGSYQDNALRSLEETYMWIGKMIGADQLNREIKQRADEMLDHNPAGGYL